MQIHRSQARCLAGAQKGIRMIRQNMVLRQNGIRISRLHCLKHMFVLTSFKTHFKTHVLVTKQNGCSFEKKEVENHRYQVEITLVPGT